MRKALGFMLAAVLVAIGGDAQAALREYGVKRYSAEATLLATADREGTVAYAIDTNAFYLRQGSSWNGVSTLVSLTGDNGGTIANGTNNVWTFTENSENLTLTFASNLATWDSTTSATMAITPALAVAGDLTLSGGASGLTFSGSASSVLVDDNDPTALLFGSTGQLNLITLDTTDDNEKVLVTGTTTTTALHVDVGDALFDEDVDVGGYVRSKRATEQITGITSLDADDCGKTFFVTDAADADVISLPSTIAGCEYRFVFVGSDGGALVDVSPDSADAVHGSCTLAASVLELSGSDDADFGLTKATINTGDRFSILGDGTEGWYVTECAGILANN